MPTTLTPDERDAKEVESLRRPKPRPSRKHRERRAPRPGQRKKRMDVHDPDLSASDPDLSMGKRSPTASVEDIAIRVFLASPSEPKSGPDGKLSSSVEEVYNLLYRQAPAVAEHFHQYAQKHYANPSSGSSPDKVLVVLRKIRSDLSVRLRDLHAAYKNANADDIARTIVENWPADKNDWAGRAAVIGSLDRAIDAIPLPDPFKAPFIRGKIGDVVRDKELLRKMVEGSAKRLHREVKDDTLIHFAQLASAWKIVSSDPPSISVDEVRSGIDKLSKAVREQSRDLIRFSEIMEGWHDSMKNLGSQGEPDSWKPGENLGKLIGDINGFLSRRRPAVDPKAAVQAIETYAKDHYGEVPKEMDAMFKGFRGKAASNGGVSSKDMTSKVATYHGTLQQGHPTNSTNTPWLSIDKRYIGEKHYKSIVKAAKLILDEEWMGWDGGAPDAKFRAALDLAIHVADGNIYQGKIDPETYDLLLNRLAGWGHDTFSETTLPQKAGSRSASTMDQHLKNIVRVASELRSENPRASFEILKSIRSLVSTEASSETIREHAAADPMPEPGPQDQTAVQQGEMVEFSSMSDDDFKKLKDDAKKLFESKDVEEFMKGFDTLHEGVKKSASIIGAVSLGDLVRVAQAHPETRQALLPLIVAAKKKAPKGKKPFGGKGAPPFKKKDDAAPKAKKEEDKKDPPKTAKPKKGKGRKASVNIEADDLNW